jgi:hypothetical protein
MKAQNSYRLGSCMGTAMGSHGLNPRSKSVFEKKQGRSACGF